MLGGDGKRDERRTQMPSELRKPGAAGTVEDLAGISWQQWHRGHRRRGAKSRQHIPLPAAEAYPSRIRSLSNTSGVIKRRHGVEISVGSFPAARNRFIGASRAEATLRQCFDPPAGCLAD